MEPTISLILAKKGQRVVDKLIASGQTVATEKQVYLKIM